jgi:N-acyl-D-amino-acid deacylase
VAIDLLVRGGLVYDGSGGAPFAGDVAISGDRIARVGDASGLEAPVTIDAAGMAVAPGFINMLSHSYYTILHDPRSLGELKQGVTTQIFGEGWSTGPMNEQMRALAERNRGELDYEICWTRLCEYLAHVEKKGTSQNVASFIGATTLRIHAVGHDDRPATPAELDLMRNLVAEEMAEGALGIGSALIYPPGCFAPTEELIELCRVASEYRGKYISHLRSEADAFLDGVQELLRIAREAGLPAENYHLKAAGPDNWPKMDLAIEMIESARASGARITADVYTYTAGATGLASSIPPRFHEGGPNKLYERLDDSGVRKQIRDAIENTTEGWENLYRAAGGADGVLILSVRQDANRKYQGRTLAQIAEMEGTDPIEALMNLVQRDRSRVGTAYFIISEDNLRKQIALPWVCFGSDAGSMASEGVFLKSHTHPRSYGTFARVLGRYVREQGVISLQEAVRKLSSLPAQTLELDRRGRLAKGFFADVVVFDPAIVSDRATYEEPHQYSVGVRDVVVNGRLALRDGEPTGALPGRAIFGPGRRT